MSDDAQALEQIIIAYRKLSERYSHIAMSYKSPRDFMEDFLFRTDALGNTGFHRAYTLDVDQSIQKRLFNIITILRDRDPFAALSSNYGNLLGLIRQAVQGGNVDLASISLKQLADELEITEKTLKTQNRRNAVSIAISIVGVILTIVFGALSLVPLITERIGTANKTAQQEIGAYSEPRAEGQ
mgnify:CR=1 FL=1